METLNRKDLLFEAVETCPSLGLSAEKPASMWGWRRLTDLESVAARLVWWKSPAESLRDRAGLLVRVMVFGTPDDLAVARRCFPDSAFRAVLAHPPPGIFDPRSWAYWHVVFGLQPAPDPPRRELPG